MKTKPFLVATVVALLAAASAGAHDYTLGALKIEHPWARPTVAGQSTGGAYLGVINSGNAPDRLLGGSSPAAARVEVHEMRMDGNVMRMREMSALDVPAGVTVKLAPGGMHLMLFGLQKPLKAGDKLPLKLRFERAGEIEVMLNVETQPAAVPVEAHKH